MNVIFLDIDGALNTYATRRTNGLDYINPQQVDMLHQLVKDTGARVVLSSTWRIREPIEYMNERLGLTLLGYTPVLGTERGQEIDRWLYDHPEVERFVILDDSNDMEPHLGRLVRTKGTHGLTWRHCGVARRMLMGG